jgi:hypothetical protein
MNTFFPWITRNDLEQCWVSILVGEGVSMRWEGLVVRMVFVTEGIWWVEVADGFEGAGGLGVLAG